jgi:membrane protein
MVYERKERTGLINSMVYSHKKLFKETYKHWLSHDPGRSGATLSFYATFSLIPLLVLAISLVSLFLSKDLIEGNITHTLTREFGRNTSEFVSDILKNASYSKNGIFSAIISIAGLLFGAIGIFSSLNKVLHDLWEEKKDTVKKENFLKKLGRFIRTKAALISFLPVLGLFLFISVIFGFFFQALSVYGNSVLHIPLSLVNLIDPLVSFALMIFIFCLTLRTFPRKKLPWSELFYGAIITASLFAVGKLVINFYLSHSSSVSLYGGAGSFAAILLWIYYSSQVFLFGASFTYVYSKKYGYLKSMI